MGKMIFQLAELIYKFVALNLLWLLFTIAGLGVFGVMPSTVALFAIIREWIKGDKDIPLFASYYKFYKGDFIRSNVLGIFFLVIFYILYVNFTFVSYFYAESIQIFIYIVIFFFAAVALMTYLNLFSIFAHFKYKTWQYIKASVGLVFLHPGKTLLQLLWVIAYLIIAVNFPRTFMVIGVSVFAYILMAINYTTFKKYRTA
ncbi:YesL family protein [Evansella clarkii]|jgi:uncharacterized membrane protein YesL|uniref:YesL family protein n=1 Tax=Evansella clarkii TaxID=79879 RepID=UPI0009966056|nr:DUF624 domain-containing protein [Evansella clarkii]